jgi:hypothetical protein
LEPWLCSLSSTELLDSLIMICDAFVIFCVYSYDLFLDVHAVGRELSSRRRMRTK